MVLPNQTSLKAQIIALFRKEPRISASDIHKILKNRYTLQAVYKELRTLLAEGIVQKIGTEWSLNMSWILQLQAFSGRLAATYFKNPSVVPAIPKGGQIRWSFRNLLDMDDYWGFVLLYLVRNDKAKRILSWNPYLWFNVFHTEHEDRFFKSVHLLNGKAYTVVGRDCFLNRWATEYLRRNNVTHSMAPSPFRDLMNVYFNVVGDYILTIKLSRNTDRDLQRLFQETQSFENLDLVNFSDILMKRGRATMTLEHNPQKAKKLRRQFSLYFGEDFSNPAG
jgi:DNA-binding Lrp family transcriptional regulator